MIGTAVLEVDKLEVRYGRSIAVRDVSISVKQGEVVCIVGPNGAGKSTTLMAIAGALKPSAGTIIFNDRPVAGMVTEDVVRCGISLVPEGRRIFARMTVAENLRLGMTVRTDRVKAAADLEQTLERFPILRARYRSQAGLLSGGEQQQLAIARALLTRPKVLLLDEPSLGLSPKMTDLVYSTLSGLRSLGLTLLIVEQSVDRISDIADRFYVVSGGVTRLSGTREQLRDNAALEKAYFGLVDAQ